MPPAVSVVVVTHRGPDPMLRTCVESLTRADGPEVRIVVVDNSGGATVEPSEYGPEVATVVRVPNRGFGAAANAGIRSGVGDDVPVVVLNDDVEVERGWLAPLLDALDDGDRVGAVQPALLDGSSAQVGSLGVRLDRFGAGSDVGIGRPVATLDGGSTPIDIFTGGAVLFRPAFLRETGGFDERYFLYYEDVDLALRGAELGWHYRCATSSRVLHHGGASVSSLGDDVLRYRERNRLWTVARFAPATTIANALWLSVRRLRHRPRRVHARALVAGVAGMPGAIGRRIVAGRDV